jgi:hypothetical protein
MMMMMLFNIIFIIIFFILLYIIDFYIIIPTLNLIYRIYCLYYNISYSGLNYEFIKSNINDFKCKR